MSSKAIIKNGIVVNIGISSEKDKPTAGIALIPDGTKVEIGYLYDGVSFSAPVKEQEPLKDVVERKLENLNKSMQSYIYGVYDIGTQASFQCLYLLPNVSEKSKTDILSVWSWTQSILIYYYQCKETILASKDSAQAKAFIYNFKQFDSTKPSTSLSEIMKELM